MTTTLPLIRIVDDDEELRNSQKMLLASLGWSVKTYESALAFLSDDELTRPGCLILDVRMPGMTGLELQQELMRREIKNYFDHLSFCSWRHCDGNPYDAAWSRRLS